MNFEDKIFPRSSSSSIDQWSKTLPRPLVFTNGCFDILHRGHVTYLQTAANMGAALMVGLNSDDSVRRQGKDPNRPLNSLQDRMAVIAALESVNAVIAFDEDTPLDLIIQVRPDVLVKGGDWAIPDIVGGAEVEGWGGSVHSIEFEFDRSTTDLVSKIRNS